MMQHNVSAMKNIHFMHLSQLYKFKFIHVASAFIRMYQDETKFTNTTIAHVSTLDDNKFQIVRRMENCLTSKPLYERIIIDRQNHSVSGFTFENQSDKHYQETFVFMRDPKDSTQTLYNSFLFKNPGMKKWMRYKCHDWGVSTLQKIIETDIKIMGKMK